MARPRDDLAALLELFDAEPSDTLASAPGSTPSEAVGRTPSVPMPAAPAWQGRSFKPLRDEAEATSLLLVQQIKRDIQAGAADFSDAVRALPAVFKVVEAHERIEAQRSQASDLPTFHITFHTGGGAAASVLAAPAAVIEGECVDVTEQAGAVKAAPVAAMVLQIEPLGGDAGPVAPTRHDDKKSPAIDRAVNPIGEPQKPIGDTQ